MNFGIIIQARTGSTRFPGKVLQKIDHRSVLEYLIDSLLKVFQHNEIIIATTILKRDDKIKLIAQMKKIKIFRGSENNVLKRYLECSKKFNLKNIIHITSDCPLVDPKLIKRMKKIFISKKFDYFSNTNPPKKGKYPDGMDIEIYKSKALLKLSKLTKLKEDKEHVTNFFWKNPDKFKIGILKNKKNMSNFKFSVDYKDDLILVKKILEKIKLKKIFPTSKNITNIIKSNSKLKILSEISRKKYKENRKDLFG
tara:strand:- start:580 stop:1338 length:759 start_codon:yes stop_codon:yes gene_type:complete